MLDLKCLIKRYQDASNAVYRSINNVLKTKVHNDITTDQFSTLHFVLENGPCTSTEIANVFGIGKSAVTAQINRLFDKELIRRERDDNDRRVIYLTVTEKGKEFVDYTEKELHSFIGRHLSNFNQEEIQQFISSLEKLAELMEERKLDSI